MICDRVPIVFVQSGDPVQGGSVQSLARPGSNMTGFVVFIQARGARSLRAIAAALNERGIPTASGAGEWQAGTVAQLRGSPRTIEARPLAPAGRRPSLSTTFLRGRTVGAEPPPGRPGRRTRTKARRHGEAAQGGGRQESPAL
jgi:hypothetical protein